MRIVIISMLFIFSYAQDCSQCENTWPDQTGYWGEQCCDVAFDQWGYDCEYMENQYGWDCTGCSCPYDDFSECGDEYCTADENFDNSSAQSKAVSPPPNIQIFLFLKFSLFLTE